jgi:hypothetical protein
MKRLLVTYAALLCLVVGCASDEPTPPRSSESHVAYHDAQYGLNFDLAPDWNGYSVLTQTWQAEEYDAKLDRDVNIGHGPIIVLRHPRWTADAPYQDIPILVFSRAQWTADMQDTGIFAGGCIDELSHNDHYVFAIHSRYNFADDVKGLQEAADIVERNSNREHLLNDR